MSTYWLWQQLSVASGIRVGKPEIVLEVSISEKTEKIYCPSSDEYIISAEIVEKAKELGATIIAYGTTWSRPTIEAIQHGKTLKISILGYSQLFAYLRRKGVNLAPEKNQ